MNAARPLRPAITLNAANDNGAGLPPRARAALRAPLPTATSTPAPECRRWHTVDGERTLSSILVVEPSHTWRMSVTAWGLVDEQRAALAWLLAHQLMGGLGAGELHAETIGSTTFVRRALSREERALLPSQ